MPTFRPRAHKVLKWTPACYCPNIEITTRNRGDFFCLDTCGCEPLRFFKEYNTVISGRYHLFCYISSSMKHCKFYGIKFGNAIFIPYLCGVKLRNMKFDEFLNKETPNEGGCMLCLAKYNLDIQAYEYRPREEYMLVERHKCANGDVFTINKKYHYDYNFAWDEQTPWEILYKKVKI